ncbi:MAG: hypothetical protein M1820_008222 [Bogoriella megaspora]|nr:MAG: hypothetical protein M1820_008222 [Bogoriella megaspora]
MEESRNPEGVLMVGSVPLASSEEVFTKICQALPGRLYTIPDGETGDRWNYIGWQLSKFPSETRRNELGGTPLPDSGVSSYSLESIQPTAYDEVAIASYGKFKELQRNRSIPADVRFQICLPTPLNSIIGHIKPELHSSIEPLYEERFFQALDHIAQEIPHKDMVIQWDLCFDVTALEFDRGRLMDPRHKAYFSPVKPGILERVSRLCDHIPSDTRIAFHLCYGDLRHKHFIEPADTGLVVELANGLINTVSKTHTVEWIHLPVPRDRVDIEYFAPLNKLNLGSSRVYLGLVHANDEDGTRNRISVARAACSHAFGVATECGLGRTPKEEIESILTICRNVTSPRQPASL